MNVLTDMEETSEMKRDAFEQVKSILIIYLS